MKDTVLVEEIWVKTNGDDATAITDDGKRLKLVAYLVNGYPIKLDEGYFFERKEISNIEAENLLKSNQQ